MHGAAAGAAAPRFRASPRLNFSLWHAGLQQAVAEWDSPVAAEVRVAGCSDVLAVPAGRRDGFTPPLNAFHLSRLDAPVATELIVEAGGESWSRPVTVSPLAAWDLRREHAAATAVFVLENDPLVGRLVRGAGMEPTPGRAAEPAEAAEGLYRQLAVSLKPGYLYERKVFPPDEQAVRFPPQMRYDLGGTCIDFVLLYAATLLRSGCAPLVLILGEEHGYGHRHAVVGLWRPGRRPRHAAVVLGPGAFRGAWRDGACFAVESTWAARGRPFPAALEEAGRALADLRLLWAIDVTAAREAKIDGLPGRPSQTVLGGWEPRITDQPTKTMTERAQELLGGLAVEVAASKTPSDAGKRWEIRGFRCRIGHGFQHEVDLDEITVSNPHAVLAVEEERILLIDLLSKNGTRVAGERLAPHVPRPLEPGAEFEVGGVTLRLVRGSAGGAGGRSS